MSRNHETPAFRLSRRLRLLIIVLAAWTGEAIAQTYIILSLIGDHVTIVGQGSQVGSHLDQNRREVVPLVESQLDDFAVRVADATIAKIRPGASVITLRAADPKLYALRDSWLDADAIGVRDLLSLVTSQIPPSPDSHLLLITPYLDQPELKTDRDSRGSGKVAGLGFYLDPMTRMRSSDTGESAPGFLGVFAHFQLVLFNLQTSAIEAQERVVVGTTYAAADAPDRTPWNALSASGKTRALASLMKGGIERWLPGMLSSQKP
jgi:hypothetical protein